MTSRRQRKVNRQASLMAILREVQAERREHFAMSSPLDAARWRPDAYGESPWNDVAWGPS